MLPTVVIAGLIVVVAAGRGFDSRRGPGARILLALIASFAVVAGHVAEGVRGGLRPPGPAARFHSTQTDRSADSGGGVIGSVAARARRALDTAPAGDVEALLVGMAMGDDSGLSARARDDFRRSSLTHVTAASGQNIALLMLLVAPLLMAAGLGRRLRLAGFALAAIAYVPFAGGQAPIQRAAVMAVAGMAAGSRGSRGGAFHPLLLAGVVTCLVDPTAPWQLGWQLSYAAVASMVTLGQVVSTRLRSVGAPPMVAEALALTASATLATAPLIAHAVGRLSLLAVPANLVAGPAAGAAMLLALAAAAVGQVWSMAATPLTSLASVPAAAVLGAAQVFGGPDWASREWHPSGTATALLVTAPVMAGCWLRSGIGNRIASVRRRASVSRRALSIPIACGVLLIPVWGLRSAQDSARDDLPPRIAFFAVGQGDATLVADGHEGILVDTGPFGSPVVSRLRAAGVEHLRAILLTHGQSDHTGGLKSVLAAYRPDVVVDGSASAPGGSTPEVARLLSSAGVSSVLPRPGMTLAAGRASLAVVGPTVRPQPGADPNGGSAVTVARIPGLAALLSADAESEDVSGLPIGRVDVLKVAHHGSDDDGLGALLDRLGPSVAVIEVGRNPYGHPTVGTLSTLRTRCKVFRTDVDGSVVVEAGASGGIIARSGLP